MKRFVGFAMLMFFMTLGTCNNADANLILIAGWTYENLPPTYSVTGQNAGPHLAETGLQAGFAPSTGFHNSTSTGYTSPSGNGSLRSFSSNTWAAGDYYQFRVNLTGYQSACIFWEQTRSGTGPSEFTLQYSTNGSTFTNLSTYTVSQITWNSSTSNPLSNFGPVLLPAATDNQSSVFVRLTSNVTTATGGTNRVDNVRILAQAVPEPTTLSLFAIAILGMTFNRKRQLF